jgi:hypothetical protein
VGPIATLNALEAQTLLSLLVIEPEFLNCPVHCLATILTMLFWLLTYAHGSCKCPILIMTKLYQNFYVSLCVYGFIYSIALINTKINITTLLLYALILKFLLLTIGVVLCLFSRPFCKIHASFPNPLNSASIKNAILLLFLMKNHTIRIYWLQYLSTHS